MTSHKQHFYPIRMAWTGNTGTGTKEYRGYATDSMSSGAPSRNTTS